MNSLGMRIVDAGDQNRDVRLIAEGGRRADDGHPFRKARFPDFRDLFRDRAKDQVERLREELLIVEAGEREQRGLGTALGKPAARTGRVAKRVAERFSGRVLGGANRGHREPWVLHECRQHLLSGEAGGAEDAYPHWAPPLPPPPASGGGKIALVMRPRRALSPLRPAPAQTLKRGPSTAAAGAHRAPRRVR